VVLRAVVTLNDEVLLLVALVLINGAFDAVVVAWLAGRRSRQALMKLVHEAATGDEDALKFLYEIGDVLIGWASAERIPTGEKVKIATDKTDEQGQTIYKEVNEVLSPIQLIARTVGNYVIMKFKGHAGGTKAQFNKMIADEVAQTGFGISPAALNAATRGQYFPALAELLAPHVGDFINKRKGNVGTSGEGNYLK
jgi:hypothetical protein